MNNILLFFDDDKGNGNAIVEPVGGMDMSFTGSLPSGCSFARADTNETYFNSSGVLSAAAIHTPCFDCDPSTLVLRGIQIQPQRVNRCPYSTLSSGWGNSGGSFGTSGTSLDGTTNARLFVCSTANSTHHTYKNVSVSYGTVYTISAYVKANGYNYIGISAAASFANGVWAFFNLATGTYVSSGAWGTGSLSSYSITAVRDGWYRITVTGSQSSASEIQAALCPAAGSVNTPGTTWAGDGSSGAYVYGVQLEAGAQATSYIPTDATMVTRAAAELSFTIPSDTSALRYVFDNDSTQDVSVSAGSYTVPTNLNRPWIKRIYNV
ncbi:MAG: hypothetical protein WC464_05385, partial [Bdellovibrionales bacterium]